MIDLRSDTVTRPSQAMLQAMAAAPLGDDVLGDDPTVLRLQIEIARRLGKEAALFVPSGSMANLIALKIHCEPGDDVIIGEGAHNYYYEAGAGGAIAGVQFTTVAQGGFFDGTDVRAAFKHSPLHHLPPTKLVCVENTHTRSGGRVWPMDQLQSATAAARALDLALHLDGARLFNASVGAGVGVAELAAPFDTVSVCFSKGLGAPVGSALAGTRAAIDRGHRYRKMLGGGMRQAGILAAAALFALENNVERLGQDHEHARSLAARLAQIPGLDVEAGPAMTNMVRIDMGPGLPDADALIAALHARGILVSALGPRRLRLVTHLDVSAADCDRAADVLTGILTGAKVS